MWSGVKLKLIHYLGKDTHSIIGTFDNKVEPFIRRIVLSMSSSKVFSRFSRFTIVKLDGGLLPRTSNSLSNLSFPLC